jgi:hypothetical protein
MITCSLGLTFPGLIDKLYTMNNDTTIALIVLDISKELQMPASNSRSTIEYLQSSHRIQVVHVPTLKHLISLVARYQVDENAPSMVVTWGLLSTYATDKNIDVVLNRMNKLPKVIIGEDHETEAYRQHLQTWSFDAF